MADLVTDAVADLVTGAMGSLIRKLGQMVKEEYNLQTGVKERVRSLTGELEGAYNALLKVAEVPPDQLDGLVKLWAREVREASYDMEDVLDTFLVRVQGRDPAKDDGLLRRLGEKMTNLFNKSKARHKIGRAIEDIERHLKEVTDRRGRYKVDDIVARASRATDLDVDPRLEAMYTQVSKLVGVDKSSSELISMLQPLQRDEMSSKNMKIVSVVGVGGLGKTTLATAVYEKLTENFDRTAFVPVGRNPDLRKVLRDILIDLDSERYMRLRMTMLDVKQLIDKLRKFFLENKRYFVVIDDIWEIQSWETIKLALAENNCGSRIIITTRNMKVAEAAGEVYRLQQLSYDNSRRLFYTRIFGDEGKCPDSEPDEVFNKIMKKCGGIPLAIITMASLLASKPREEWSEVYGSIGFGHNDDRQVEITRRILSFSYYDMRPHLRTCLLYLSAFPEDSVIRKDELIWKWIAEGFVQEKQGKSLFDQGERYFIDLMNRSMIQVVQSHEEGIYGCLVHDIVLDFLRYMSCEENFFTILDNDRGTLPQQQSKVRRLTLQTMTFGHTDQANHMDMGQARSFIACRCVLEHWVPYSSFKLLRVLAIENCNPADGCDISVEHLGRLLHLRYLSLRGTRIRKLPEEIGALSFLQTLDLWKCETAELPSSISLLTQLLCLRVTYGLPTERRPEVVSVAKLTSLQQLEINADYDGWSVRRLMKELGVLRELRVLKTPISLEDESESDLLDSLQDLPKLQHLRLFCIDEGPSSVDTEEWEEEGFDLPKHLRHFFVDGVTFDRLPSCIHHSCLPNLSHLSLIVGTVDDQDLAILGALPELHYLHLKTWSTITTTISSFSGSSQAGYFQKLRCCELSWSMVRFVPNKEGRIVSFHIWNGEDEIEMPSFSSDQEKEDATDSEAGAPTFMPSLQVLEFSLQASALKNQHCFYDDIGLEHLPSLEKVRVRIQSNIGAEVEAEVEAAEVTLRHAADVHPNHPSLHIWKS
ncbi:unnamed protein product [Urochloa humidicola]